MHLADVFKSHNLKSRWRRPKEGSFFVLKHFQDVFKISTWAIGRRSGMVLKTVFPNVLRHRVNVFKSWSWKLRQFEDRNLSILNTLSEPLWNISTWTIWRRYRDVLEAVFPLSWMIWVNGYFLGKASWSALILSARQRSVDSTCRLQYYMHF